MDAKFTLCKVGHSKIYTNIYALHDHKHAVIAVLGIYGYIDKYGTIDRVQEVVCHINMKNI